MRYLQMTAVLLFLKAEAANKVALAMRLLLQQPQDRS
jgi:hypothetical protein